MDIARFKAQHDAILEGINELRRLSHAGVEANSTAIAQRLKELSSLVNVHLAVEDRILYPAVKSSSNPNIAKLGEAYQAEMTGIANAYIAFARRWSVPASLRNDPAGFKQAANSVLRLVYERLQKE